MNHTSVARLNLPLRHVVMYGRVDRLSKESIEEQIDTNREFILIHQIFIAESKLSILEGSRRIKKWNSKLKISLASTVTSDVCEERDTMSRENIEKQINLNRQFIFATSFHIKESIFFISRARIRINEWKKERKERFSQILKPFCYEKPYIVHIPLLRQNREINISQLVLPISVLIEKNAKAADQQLIFEHILDKMILKLAQNNCDECNCCLSSKEELEQKLTSLHLTKCNHCVCQECLLKLIFNSYKEKRDVFCPICRSNLLRQLLNISIDY